MARRHDQRGIAARPARDINVELGWVAETMSSLEGTTTPIHVDSILALQMGDTRERRESRLRKLTELGFLQMSAKRVGGKFVRFEWSVR